MKCFFYLWEMDTATAVENEISSFLEPGFPVPSYNAQNKSPSSPYAYTFVMGGVNPMRPSYRGMLWGIVVSVYALKKYGSHADFILFVQPSAETSGATANQTKPSTSDNRDMERGAFSHDPFGLAQTERKLLDKLGVQLRIIETGQVSENFHDITMNKFIVLTLSEYKKVIFLDADLVLLGSLDYLFEAPFLRRNFYMATAGEAANAGLFMVTPQEGDYQEVLNIIKAQKESAKKLPGEAKFDKIHGWGHRIVAPDYWETTRTKGKTAWGTDWFFYCAPSDQGLLYHWTKYVQRSVSIMIRDDIKYWGPHPFNETLKVQLEGVLHDPFRALTKPTLKSKWSNCDTSSSRGGKTKWWCVSPHRDYEHLAGTAKPWRQPIPDGAFGENATKDALHYWFHLFHEMNASPQYSLGINFDEWEEERRRVQEPPLGWKPHYYSPKCTGCQFTR